MATAQRKSMHSEVKTSYLNEDQMQELRNKMCHKNGLSREETLKAIASGEKLAALERRKGLKPNEIYYWMKKWNITGVSQMQAIELLNGNTVTPKVEAIEVDKTLTALPESYFEDQQLENKKIQLPKEACDVLDQWMDKKNLLITKHAQMDKELPYSVQIIEPYILAQALCFGYKPEPEPTTEEEKALKKAWMEPPWPIYEMASNIAYRCGLRDGLSFYGHIFNWMKEK